MKYRRLFRLAAAFILSGLTVSVGLALDCPGITQSGVVSVVRCLPPDPDDPISQLLRIALGPSHDPITIALVAGIENYPLISGDEAGNVVERDISLLTDLFADKLKYDFVITVKNEGISPETLNRLLGVELPALLKDRQGSQVVLAYSGHGAQYGKQSYLLTTKSTDLVIRDAADLTASISLSDLKQIIAPTVKSSFQFLLLLNSCYGGELLRERMAFGDPIFSTASAQGITAGREQDLVYGLGEGRGSVLFEYFSSIMTSAITPPQVLQSRFDEGAARAGGDGIVTLSEIAFLLKPAVEELENYRVSPQFGNLVFASTNEDRQILERKEGDFFFITNQDAADQALQRSRWRSYRDVKEGMGVALPPPPLSVLVRTEFSSQAATEISSQYDWRLFRVSNPEGRSICYVESKGVASLNSMLDILRPRVPYAGGEFSKLRFAPAQPGLAEEDIGFWYVFSDDLPTMNPAVNEFNFYFFEQLATFQLQVDVRYPYALRSEGVGVGLSGTGRNVEDTAKSGSFVTVTGYLDLGPLPLTPAVEALSQSTRSFVHSRLLRVLLQLTILGGDDLIVKNPTLLAQLVKYDDVGSALTEAANGRISMTDDLGNVRSVNAGYQALPSTEKSLLDGLSPEDWAVFLSALGFRSETFADSISFMGFTAILRDFDSKC